MLFNTPVELPLKAVNITHRSRLMLVGSCFADNIGNKLAERKFNIDINPFGILYNPLSIATMLTRVATGEEFDETSPEIFANNDKWHSLLHHGSFSRNNREELLQAINNRLQRAHASLPLCNAVIITLGTAYAYTRNSDNLIAGNCHKLPGRMFTRRLLNVQEIADTLSEAMNEYIKLNPEIKFIFTVSPIRHLRDGAHDNQKSKATLLLAIDAIMQRHPRNSVYFPAYEIMMDELRDYRYYADDMLHPSAKAVEYIWECFGRCCFDEFTKKLNEKTEEIISALMHRPFDPQSPQYKLFVQQTVQKIETLQKEHPYIDFEKEKEQCNILLNK